MISSCVTTLPPRLVAESVRKEKPCDKVLAGIAARVEEKNDGNFDRSNCAATAKVQAHRIDRDADSQRIDSHGCGLVLV